MPLASPHLLVGFATLFFAAYQDWRTLRISNLLLLSATALHLSLSQFEGLDYRGGFLLLTLSVILIITPKMGPVVIRNIGMGDIKLSIYMAWSIGSWINWPTFLFTLAVMSTIVLIGKEFFVRGERASQAFAPFLAVAAVGGVWG